jgi:uncharacterized protein YbjT (DUF2867 family)
MQVAVIGATGIVGRHVVPRLREHGHHVRAVVRSEADVEALRCVGIEALRGDILDRHCLRQAVEGCSVAFHLATAAPRPGQAPNWALNDRIPAVNTQKGRRRNVEAIEKQKTPPGPVFRTNENVDQTRRDRPA